MGKAPSSHSVLNVISKFWHHTFNGPGLLRNMHMWFIFSRNKLVYTSCCDRYDSWSWYCSFLNITETLCTVVPSVLQLMMRLSLNTCWSDIRWDSVRLGGAKYKSAIDYLETEYMDPEVEEHCKEFLSQWKKDECNVNDQLYELGTIIKNVIQRLDDLNLKWNISILTSVSWNFFYIIFVLSKLTYLRRPLYLRNKRERPLVKSSMRREQIVKLKILNA